LYPFKTFFEYSQIIDEQIFDIKTTDKLMEGIEEFALFFMKNFRGQLDLTYFFFRPLYAQFSFNLDSAIKVLYCLHKMSPDDKNLLLQDDTDSADEEEVDNIKLDDSYGDYDEEDYGEYGEEEEDEVESQDEEEKATHSKHS